jgi:hypothetical protein
MRSVIALQFALASTLACTNDRPPPAPNAVELVSPGAEPRRVVRYTVAKGTKATLELALDLSVTADAMGGAVPTVVNVVELEATESLFGTVMLQMKVVDVDTRDREGTQIPAVAATGPIAPLRGLVITGLLTPDGRLSSIHVTHPAKLPQIDAVQIDALSRNFAQLTMALPDDPVGTGATWKISRPIEEGGLKMTADTTVQLVKLDGDVLTFTTTARISGPDQTASQDGVAIEVAHPTGTGESHGTIDLARLVMTGELAVSFTADMTAAGERSTMKATSKLVVTPK